VQPVDPLDEWESQPFEPEVRGDNLYARGASDMKGQLVAILKALEAMVHASHLPLNLKFMFEGEEEIGSPSLPAFIEEHKDLLASAVCLNTDAGILTPDQPALTIALRGLTYFEIRIQGQNSDLHSGTFGGVIDNPAIVLCQLVAGMRDRQGKILLPGFYDDVRDLTQEERDILPSLSDEWWLESAGTQTLFGEEGYPATERATTRPTLDINGLLSGFTSEGSKTVLPAKAMAKVSMRLVPDQVPARIKESLIKYMEENTPPTMTWEIEDLSSATPAIIDRNSEAVKAASQALETVWGISPVYTRAGGTVPVVSLIKEILGIDSLMLGFGLPNDNIHGPNEKQHLPSFYRGIETFIHFIETFSGIKSSKG
ncbi:MAG: M20/M25/M40 family metallo-hydrolase, partial [Anaerolineales bacterium]